MSARPRDMRQRSKTLPSWALFDCLERRGQGGETKVFMHLEIWAPNMYPAKAEPLPPTAFHPPPPYGLRTCRTPPPPSRFGTSGGGGSRGKSGVANSTGTPPPPLHPSCPLHPPDPREHLASLLSTPVTIPGPGAGVDRVRTGGVQPAFALGVRPAHRPPCLSSLDTDGRADQQETA